MPVFYTHSIISSFYHLQLLIPDSHIFQANGEAALGKYGGGVAGAAGDSSLFIKDHAY